MSLMDYLIENKKICADTRHLGIGKEYRYRRYSLYSDFPRTSGEGNS